MFSQAARQPVVRGAVGLDGFRWPPACLGVSHRRKEGLRRGRRVTAVGGGALGLWPVLRDVWPEPSRPWQKSL